MVRNSEQEAREARAAFEHIYGELSVSELGDTIIQLLDEIEDLAEQRKAHMDSMKEVIDGKEDAIKYCRSRRHALRTEGLIANANDLLANS